MLGSTITKARTFGRDQDGSVAIMFGLSCVVLCMGIGLSIDIGRTINSRAQVAAAADAAALAASKGMRLEGLTQAEAIDLAKKVFIENMKGAGGKWTNVNTINVTIDPVTGGATVDIDATVNTTFAAVSGIASMPVTRVAGAVFDSRDIEVGVQLDLTGSMCSPCSKLDALKEATKDLVDILIPDYTTPQKVRIGLAPFSAGVNVGPYLRSVNGDRASVNNCVYERRGSANDRTDALPAGPADTFKIRSDLTGSVQPCPQTAIVPLTSDKTLLKNTADGFRAVSSTAGQLGAAWAWYLVSPAWKTIWPSASEPAPYKDSKTDKVVILMTDGVYNTIGGVNHGDTSAQAVQASTMSVDICTNMKKEGVKIYTVGFDLDSIGNWSARTRATDTLKACATQEYPGDTSNFYKADNADDLRAAFRNIANNIMTLRLSQ